MTTTALPHWDLSHVYSGLDSAEFQADLTHASNAIAALAQRFDTLGIDARPATPLSTTDQANFEEVLAALSNLREQLNTLRVYIYSFVSTDSRNQTAQAYFSELQQRTVLLDQISTRFTAWIGSLEIEALIAHSAPATIHAYLIRRAAEEAQHLMSPAEESLAAELGPSAGSAWGRLHSDISSQLLVAVTLNGQQHELPMTMVRNLAYDADRERRRIGYEAELAAWKRAEVPLAAAMNGIKGEGGVLATRRRWESPLAEALFDNAIDQATLDAMLTAAHEAFPSLRRYFQAKARLLGQKQLAWYDLFAPVGTTGGRVWTYDTALDFIIEHFGSFAPHMADLAKRAFDQDWIDAEPRAGKAGGAFCTRLQAGESRILTNYTDSINSVLTLAHELGHAYHNYQLASQPPLNRSSPMTLAETASIFCETIVRQAALANAEPNEQLVILEAALQNAGQIVVDITSRFIFERDTFAKRRQRALSADELSAIMCNAQLQTYGEGLDPNLLHPYMWAAKPHYYSAGRSFYNYPYMFGLLFGLGLYAIYRREPAGFVERYDKLLSSTGQADAATLAASVGIDIRTPDFWRASLATITADVDLFVSLVEKMS